MYHSSSRWTPKKDVNSLILLTISYFVGLYAGLALQKKAYTFVASILHCCCLHGKLSFSGPILIYIRPVNRAFHVKMPNHYAELLSVISVSFITSKTPRISSKFCKKK